MSCVWRDVVAACSQEEMPTQFNSTNHANFIVSRGIVGGVLCMEGHSVGLLSGGDPQSGSLHHLAKLAVSRGHSRWCPVYGGT